MSDLTADTLTVLGAFADMVRHTDRYPTKDDLGDDRTVACLAYALDCVARAARGGAVLEEVMRRVRNRWGDDAPEGPYCKQEIVNDLAEILAGMETT